MATAIKMPRLSKGMTSGTVLEWLKNPEETVEAGEPLFHVLTEKADVEVEAPAEGVLLRVDVMEGEEAAVGEVLGWIGETGERLEDTARSRKEEKEQRDRSRDQATELTKRVKASPVARRLAAEHGLSLGTLEGTGPRGMITKSDVEWALEGKEEAALSAQLEVRGVAARYDQRIPLDGVRRVMAERMAQSKRTAADVTTIVDVDMGAVRSLKDHVSVTYTSAVVKAAGTALRKQPMLNGSLDEDEIVLHRDVNVGVAVDGARGLTVVTVGNVDGKSLRAIDNELRELAEAAKDGSLATQEVVAPTFTVSNSGVLGSLMFTPIINPPQSGILGMGKVHETPVVKGGEIVVGWIMYLCLTYDHRMVEGAEAVGFLQEVKRCLEDPVRMM